MERLGEAVGSYQASVAAGKACSVSAQVILEECDPLMRSWIKKKMTRILGLAGKEGSVGHSQMSEEMVSEFTVVVLEAALSYDPEHGTLFTTWLTRQFQAAKEDVVVRWEPVSMSSAERKTGRVIAGAYAELTSHDDIEPSVSQLVDVAVERVFDRAYDIAVKRNDGPAPDRAQVEAIVASDPVYRNLGDAGFLNAAGQAPASFDQPIGSTDDGSELKLGDTLATPVPDVPLGIVDAVCTPFERQVLALRQEVLPANLGVDFAEGEKQTSRSWRDCAEILEVDWTEVRDAFSSAMQKLSAPHSHFAYLSGFARSIVTIEEPSSAVARFRSRAPVTAS